MRNCRMGLPEFTGWALLSLGCIAVGCETQSKTNANSVAIVDLDEVAKRLGRDSVMASAIEQRQTSLNQQVAKVQSSLQEQLHNQKSGLGDAPTDDQARQLILLQNDANQKLNQLRLQAQANVTQFQQATVNQFREEAKPVAKQIALERGCNVVLTKNDTVVFAFDDAIDITDEIIARMLTSRTIPKPVSGSAGSSTH